MLHLIIITIKKTRGAHENKKKFFLQWLHNVDTGINEVIIIIIKIQNIYIKTCVWYWYIHILFTRYSDLKVKANRSEIPVDALQKYKIESWNVCNAHECHVYMVTHCGLFESSHKHGTPYYCVRARLMRSIYSMTKRTLHDDYNAIQCDLSSYDHSIVNAHNQSIVPETGRSWFYIYLVSYLH